MSSVSSFFTQATNFGSAVSGGVDPRTGLFTVQIGVGDLVGNRNLGPSLPLRMSYSPLDGADAGFGQGVSLGLTTYDTKNRLLVLSTGERYKVHETDTRVNLLQSKLDTVHVTKDTDRNFYRIVHKSGDVEILTGPWNAFTLKVPTALLTPAGHRLTLTWVFSGAQPRLTEITDESDTLLKVAYTETKTILSVLPGQGEGYDVEFRFQNSRLGSVYHSELGEKLTWEFTYSSMGQRGEWGSWITGVRMPGGMTETANYRNEGHRFPDSAGLPALPYVDQFVQRPGGGQPPIEASYRYTNNNFVGGGTTGSWDSGRDNLYELLTDYKYGSKESWVCGDRTTTITREYNQYHLQTVETTRQNGCCQDVRTDYYAVGGRPFEEQPTQFQLPTKRTVTWTDPSGNSRNEITLTSFDSAGNPESQTEPDGTKTTWEFYPATGSGTGCPPEPNGFTRLLQQVTRTPPKTAFDAPVYSRSYRYEAYTGTPDEWVGTAVLKSEESRYADHQLLRGETFTYATSGEEFGRVTEHVETEYPSGVDTESYTAIHTFTFSKQGDRLVQTHSLTTHDRLTTPRSQTRSRFTGRLLSATDPQGNVATTTYDGLGRELTYTENPNTPYEAKQTHTYAMGGTAAPFVVTSTDALGNQLRETLDGAGRPITREREDTDDDGAWYTVQTLSYDARGRASSISALDHVRGGGEIELTQTFSYDDWGQLATTARSDGSAELTRTDPVKLTTTTQWLDGGAPVTGTVVTTHNTRGEPVSVERFDLTGSPAGRRTLDRDGWGRVRRETDELGNQTHYDYDPRGRVTCTTLPDGTKITRGYAPFSPVALTTQIAVNDSPYGTQSFDGLGRITTSSSGGRDWTHHYSGPADPLPDQVTGPDGQVHAFQYIPQLGNAVSWVSADSLTQQYTRHPLTGAVTRATDGDTTIACGYYPSGLLHTDTTTLPGRPARTTEYSYTVNGLPQSCTGIDTTVEQYTRDQHGRITAITDPAVHATVSYDTADRVSGWVATDAQTGHTLTTTLTRDDLGREVKRTITDGQTTTTWTLTHTWKDNDQLAGRTFSRATTLLREESFTYDTRNRLTGYTCTGTTPPHDDHDNPITHQSFTYDAYGNITRADTTFGDGSTDTATYQFGNTNDPCQLTHITHTHPQSDSTLVYDQAGQLTTDDTGRILTYDTLGRLSLVNLPSRSGNQAQLASRYGYDPLDRLATQQAGDITSTLYYRGFALTSVITANQHTRLLRLGQICVSQHSQPISDTTSPAPPAGTTWLLGTDAKPTILLATTGTTPEEYAYTAYGHRPAHSSSLLGYDGQRTDPILGCYHLGNGYRAYNPTLMRFHTPDTLSPFDGAGINPYTYCDGDPINRIDPSGHLSWQAWLGIGLGILGLAAAAFTAGTSIIAAGGVIAALEATSATALAVGALGVASDVTAITSGALEEASPKASSILGWISLGTGLAGAAGGLGKAATRRLSRGIADRSGVSVSRAQGALLEESWDGVEVRVGRGRGYLDGEAGTNYRATLNDQGQRVWLTKYETNANEVERLARSRLNAGRDVTVLTGTHGDPYGNETHLLAYQKQKRSWWFLKPKTRRYLKEPKFFNEDVGTANSLRQQFPNRQLRVLDKTDHAVWSNQRDILQGNTEVIVGLCFSRNEREVREILGLGPSTSYI